MSSLVLIMAWFYQSLTDLLPRGHKRCFPNSPRMDNTIDSQRRDTLVRKFLCLGEFFARVHKKAEEKETPTEETWKMSVEPITVHGQISQRARRSKIKTACYRKLRPLASPEHKAEVCCDWAPNCHASSSSAGMRVPTGAPIGQCRLNSSSKAIGTFKEESPTMGSSCSSSRNDWGQKRYHKETVWQRFCRSDELSGATCLKTLVLLGNDPKPPRIGQFLWCCSCDFWALWVLFAPEMKCTRVVQWRLTFLAGHGEIWPPHGRSTWWPADQPTTRRSTWTWCLFKENHTRNPCGSACCRLVWGSPCGSRMWGPAREVTEWLKKSKQNSWE